MHCGLLVGEFNEFSYFIVKPVLIAWFNYCVLLFAKEISNLLIAFASHDARKVRYK